MNTNLNNESFYFYLRLYVFLSMFIYELFYVLNPR